MSFKNVFYDWFGFNQALQKHIHNITECTMYHNIVIIGSSFFGNYLFFPVHMILIIIALALIIHKKNQKLSKSSLINYYSHIITVGYVILVSLIVGAICIECSKRYFSLPRPFCAYYLSQTVLLPNCFRSMPSGHSAYITIMVMSIWSLLNIFFRCVALITVFLVYFSRIALDMHYPADVLYSVLIAGLITFFVIKYIDKLSCRFNGINYYIIKFLTKI